MMALLGLAILACCGVCFYLGRLTAIVPTGTVDGPTWEKTVRMFSQHARVTLLTVAWRRGHPELWGPWLKEYEEALGLAPPEDRELSQ
jgi:hypothetical protein